MLLSQVKQIALVAAVAAFVMAQRLLRRLCTHCKQKYEPTKDEVPADFPWDLKNGPIYKAVGCRECRNTGYRGRLGIYELLITTNDIRQLATDRVASWKIMQAAVKEGNMRSLRGDAWLKVLHGVSTVDEVAKNAKADHNLLIKR